MPSEDEVIMFRYVLNGVVSALVARVTNNMVDDADEISLEYSVRVGHLAQADAVRACQEAPSLVLSKIQTALQRYTASNAIKSLLSGAKARPIVVSDTELILNGKRINVGDPEKATAYYDLLHPWSDFVTDIIPVVAPELNSEPDVYEFIGARLNDTKVMARARLLLHAIKKMEH